MQECEIVRDFRARYANTIIGLLGVELIPETTGTLRARMTVGDLALNSQGGLHGGISPLVAETLASFASLFPIRESHGVAGVSVYSNHVQPGRRGEVVSFEVLPQRTRGRLQVWTVEMRNAAGELLSLSQVTVVVIPQRASNEVPDRP